MAKVLGKNAKFAITEANALSADVAKPTAADDATYAYDGADTVIFQTLANEITLSIESRTEDSTPYNSDFDEFDVLTYTWTYDVNAFHHDDDDETEELLMKGLLNLFKKRFLFSPAGGTAVDTTTGDASLTKPKYLGRVIISSCSSNPARGGIAQIRASIQGDGPLFRDIS